MKPYTVVFAPAALDSLVELYEYIAVQRSPMVARRYTDAIVSYCVRLGRFPASGPAS